LFVLFVFFIICSVPVFAANNQAKQELPTWLSEIGAKPIPDIKATEIQGEVFLSTLTYYAVVYGLPLYVNSCANFNLSNQLTKYGLRYLITDWINNH